jgi:hypothetical protein
MSDEIAIGIASHCSCGASLRWESREGYGQRRSVALCSNADCGLITTASPEGVQPEEALESFLLGPVPARRYLKPWVRTYFRTAAQGFQWRPHHEVCPDCSGEITVHLGLPPLPDRQGDFHQLVICLGCGATGMAFWITGERVAIAMDGSEWSEPSTAVVILKRILQERAAMICEEGRRWDFPQ